MHARPIEVNLVRKVRSSAFRRFRVHPTDSLKAELQTCPLRLRLPPRGRLDAPTPFVRTHLPRNGMADFLEAGKIPKIREVAALLGLHRLDGAIIADQELTFAIRLFKQRQTFAIRTHPRMAFDELRFAHVEVRRNLRNLGIGQPYLSRPATTRRAPLTFVENRHAGISRINAPLRNAEARSAAVAKPSRSKVDTTNVTVLTFHASLPYTRPEQIGGPAKYALEHSTPGNVLYPCAAHALTSPCICRIPVCHD